MEQLYPVFNAAETEVVAGLSDRTISTLTTSLRRIVNDVEALGSHVALDDESA